MKKRVKERENEWMKEKYFTNRQYNQRWKPFFTRKYMQINREIKTLISMEKYWFYMWFWSLRFPRILNSEMLIRYFAACFYATSYWISNICVRWNKMITKPCIVTRRTFKYMTRKFKVLLYSGINNWDWRNLQELFRVQYISPTTGVDYIHLWNVVISCKNYLVLFTIISFNMAVVFNPYPTAFPYGNGMVLHFYQQQESSTTKTVNKVINKRLKTYVYSLHTGENFH